MADKITKAMNDGAARANAVEVLGLGAYAKVSNTEYALTVKDLEGNDKVVVVKLTVPKAQLPIDQMVNAYESHSLQFFDNVQNVQRQPLTVDVQRKAY